jgi:hypothetical protein
LLAVGTVVAIAIAGHWTIAIVLAIVAIPTFFVVSRIFVATEREDFPGFIEDVFPDEVDEVRRKEKKQP